MIQLSRFIEIGIFNKISNHHDNHISIETKYTFYNDQWEVNADCPINCPRRSIYLDTKTRKESSIKK